MQTLSVWFVSCRHEWKAQIHIRKACSFSPYHRSGHVFSSSKLTKSWNLPFSILLVPPGRMNTGSLNSRAPWLQTAAPGKSVKCLVPFFHLFASWKFRFFDHFVAFFVPICFWKWTWRGHTDIRNSQCPSSILQNLVTAFPPRPALGAGVTALHLERFVFSFRRSNQSNHPKQEKILCRCTDNAQLLARQLPE